MGMVKNLQSCTGHRLSSDEAADQSVLLNTLNFLAT